MGRGASNPTSVKDQQATETSTGCHSGKRRRGGSSASGVTSTSSQGGVLEATDDDRMTGSGESRKEARVLTNGIFGAKTFTKIGTWNVRTLSHDGKLEQLIEVIKTYNISVMGIAEMRWTGQGRIRHDGFEIFYAGHESHHVKGVGIVLDRKASSTVVSWKPVNERIITVRLKAKLTKVTVVQVYAPTEDTPDEEKDDFYEQLQKTLDEVPSFDNKIVIGDFNAKLDSDRRDMFSTVGPFGSATNTNDNGERLLQMASENGLSVGNTFFDHKRIHKMTWTSPGGSVKNEIDYICMSSRWRSSLLDVRTQRGADIGSDHSLVVGKVCIKLKTIKQKKVTKPFAIHKLKNVTVSERFSEMVQNRFGEVRPANDIENQWTNFMSTTKECAEEVVGRRRGSQKERWISDESWSLIDERKEAKIERDRNSNRATEENYRRLIKEVKKSCRRDKRAWLESKGKEAQEAADRNDSKTLYKIVRELSGGRSSSSVPIKAKDGRTLVTSEEQAERWVEHFSEVLNQPEPTGLFDFDTETQNATPLDVDLEDISVTEVSRAISKLKNNKSAGIDEIPAELLKHGGLPLHQELTSLCNLIWSREEVPEDWRKGIIVPLPKKGALSNCNNWRGITLLSIPGKVFCAVLLNRLKDHIDIKLREEQAGFRQGRSCCEQIFTLRNIIEQCLEFRSPLFINYIDFKKAFDSIHRHTLWKILEVYGVPRKFIDVIKSLYHESSCCVRTNEGNTHMFNIVSGVRQGCILSPFLFLIVIDYIMKKSMTDASFGIRWKQNLLTDLDFADDLALLGTSPAELQNMTDSLQRNAEKVGLRISYEKTKTMGVGATLQPPVSIDQKDVETVANFQYLGSYLSNNGDTEYDVKTRIGKASAVFKRLYPIWRSRSITLRVKLKLYMSIVVPTAIYASETWKTNAKINNRLDVFHRRCLRGILGITWRDRITNEEVMHRTEAVPLHDIVTTRRRKLAGHVLRLESERHAHTAMTWSPHGGKRSRGRPKRTWRSTFKDDLKEMGVQWENAQATAAKRTQWRRLTRPNTPSGVR